jgi:hypothetical protein
MHYSANISIPLTQCNVTVTNYAISEMNPAYVSARASRYTRLRSWFRVRAKGKTVYRPRNTVGHMQLNLEQCLYT